MIKSLKITKLFNRFDYEIELKEGGITILTGPNGFGKSTILKIIYAISKANFPYFYGLEFKIISIEFANQKTITITKIENDLVINKMVLPKDLLYKSTSEIRRNFPWIVQIGFDRYVDRRTDEIFTREELNTRIFDNFEDYQLEDYELNNIKEISALINKMKKYCGKVQFITEQRLIRQEIDRNKDKQVINVINELPNKLKAEISVVVANYSKVANSLDSSYPKRLLSTKIGLKNKLEYQENMNEAYSKFEKLSRYDLVDLAIIKSANYEEEFSKALKIYFEDFTEKYRVFESFIAKLDLYTKIINSRLTFKEIRITRNDGFIIVDLRDSKPLNLDQLSSGEKQEIVLFYELIFGTESQLLLIDEPEISLHIAWQKMFMDDLLEVAKMGQLEVIVATHSPQIINNHWDIQIDLGELYVY